MNPGTVLGQSIAAGAVLTALACYGRPTLTAVLAAAGGLWALAFNVGYARKLGSQGRTPRRIYGDRAIARQLVLSYAIPIVTAVVVSLTGWDSDPEAGPFSSAEVQGLLGVIAVMLVGWLASSHVDWYYIRARIDGVVTEPPCRTSRATMWKGVTRKWYIHRAAASLLTVFAVVAVAVIVTLMLDREWPGALGLIGGFAAIVGVGLWLFRDEIRNAGPTVGSVRSPRYWVGDDLKYDTDVWRRRGYVLHVAIPVTKLVLLDRASGEPAPAADFVEEPATVLHAAHLEPTAFTGCLSARDHCGGMNPECLYGLTRQQVGHRRIVIW